MIAMLCPSCGGHVEREPASVTCRFCGRWGEILDASEQQRFEQRRLDWFRRPRSIECWPEYQDLLALPPRLGRGWVKLPGDAPMKRGKAMK